MFIAQYRRRIRNQQDWDAGQRQLVRRPWRKRQGYTLVEVIIALAVILIGLLGVFSVLTSTILTNTQSRNMAFATRFAEKQLEVVRSTRFLSITTVSAAPSSELTASLGTGATWRRTVTAVGTTGTMLGVTITVQWTEGQQNTSISLSTLVNRDGINAIRNI